MADTLFVEQGLGSSWTLQLRDSGGNAFTSPPGPYTGTEALSATVRAGQAQAPLFSLSPTWASASAGTITLAIAGSLTAGLSVGRYLLQVALADDSADLVEAFLEVTYSPGSAAAQPSYCSFQDLLDRAPWIEKLQRPTDLAGFARQRYLALSWFQDLLYRHYRGASGLLTDFYFVPGISFGGRFGEAVYYRDGRRSSDLQGWLAANRLDVTDQVVEANALWAIALICDRQVGPAKDTLGYAVLARKYFALAEACASNITAELDTDGDGTNDTIIRLGISDTLDR